MPRSHNLKGEKRRKIRDRLSEQQNHRCCTCGIRFTDHGLTYATLEHVIPASVRRSNTQDNLVLTCWRCNNEGRAWRIWQAYCRRRNLPIGWHLDIPWTFAARLPLISSASDMGVNLAVWSGQDGASLDSPEKPVDGV